MAITNKLGDDGSIYLGSGQTTYNVGSQFGYNGNYVYSLSGSDWNSANIINGVPTGPFPGTTLALNQSGGANVTYDLTGNTFQNIHLSGQGDNLTLKINSADASGISSFYGAGANDQLVTSDATLDLSHTSITNFQVLSTNPTGTTFTVQDLGTAFQIAGGPGQDTIVYNGFQPLTDDQRNAIFATASIETIIDPSGTYTAPPLREPPVLGGVPASASFKTGQGAVQLAPNLFVSSPSSGTLSAATVSITAGSFSGDADVLAAITTGTSITANYNSGTETLTLAGSDTLAHYIQVLRSISYGCSSSNPTHDGLNTSRTVTWVVNSGDLFTTLGATATTRVSISPSVDSSPAITASNLTATHGQVFAASNLFIATDPDGDAITKYDFWNMGTGGGHFVVNGQALGTQQENYISASQLSQTAYQSSSGTDTLWVRVSDGDQWSAWSQSFTVTAPIDTGPTVVPTSTNMSASHNQSIAASTPFIASDPFNDPVTEYDFWNMGTGGGHFVLNNQVLGAGQENLVSASQLSQTTYQSGSGTDTLWVRVSDGDQWSPWSQSFTVTAPIDTGPVVTPVSSFQTTMGRTFAASSLFTASDPFGDAIEEYDFWDTGAGGGHFAINGQPLGINQDNIVSAAQLGQTSYVPGSGTDTLWVRVSEGEQWSAWSQAFTITAFHTGPVVTTPYVYTTLDYPSATYGTAAADINNAGLIVGRYGDQAGTHGFLFNAGIYTTVNDNPHGTVAEALNDAEQIVGSYTDYNAPRTYGFLNIDNVNYHLTDPLASIMGDPGFGTSFFSGINNAGQIVGSYVNSSGYHGFLYSALNGSSVVTNLNDPLATGYAGGPPLTFANGINDAGQIVGMYSDATQYHGFVYEDGSYINIDDPVQGGDARPNGINNLGQIVGTFRDSTGDHAFLYSAGNYITLDDPSAEPGTTSAYGINDAGQIVGMYFDSSGQHGFLATPQLTAHDGQSFAASSLFTASDPDGRAITEYDFWNTGTGGGHFVLNGVGQASNQEIDVTASEVGQLSYQAGSGGDTLWIRASDAMMWGPWSQAFTVAAPLSKVPEIGLSSQSNVPREVTLALSALVAISDPDNVGYQKLELWDSNGTVAGGQFVVDGIAQTGGHEIDVSPTDVANTIFDVGTLGGSDTLWAQLVQNNGQTTGWLQFTVTAQTGLPTLSVWNNGNSTRGQQIALSNLVSIADSDGVGYQKLELWDSNGTVAGGQFVVNGVAQTWRARGDQHGWPWVPFRHKCELCVWCERGWHCGCR